MKFIFGNPPLAQQQDVEGWRVMPALGAKVVQTYGLMTSCAGMLLLAVLLRGAIRPSGLAIAVLVLVTTLPLHELVHALATPGWGLSTQTIIGIQGGKNLLLPYMFYTGAQPCWRMLLTGLAPFMILTVLPVVLILVAELGEAACSNLGFIAFFNISVSGGDLFTTGWIITHLPLRATVKGSGWGLFWKDNTLNSISR